MSVDRLSECIRQKHNPTVLGLDPRPEHIPPELLRKHIEEQGKSLAALCAATEEMNRRLIEALHDIVPAVKLQCACYEQLGPEGMAVMARLLRYAKEHGLYTMADGKRGDIGSSAEGYAAAWLGRVALEGELLPVFDADALTINPYLGSDNLTPFLEECKRYDKMVFVLCRTSNHSSREVQELICGDRPLYRVIAEQVDRVGIEHRGSGGFTNVGMVVGATRPKHLRDLRIRHPGVFFLIPGYGAQGGRAEDVALGFDRYGRGAIVNNSRGICCAYQKLGGSLEDAARKAALIMRDALASFITIL